jgi:hypothetical protein
MGRKSSSQLAAEAAANAASAEVITESPEFKAKVAEAAAEAVKGILGTLQLGRESHGTADAPAASIDNKFAEGLAMALAQLTDQGTGRKRVAPELMRKRAEARELMENLLIEARASGKVPKYTLRNKVYLDETLVDPMWLNPATKIAEPTVIEWPGVPNEVMSPENEVAKDIHGAYMESIGSVVKVVTELPAYMTPNGLTVNGRAPARRTNNNGVGEAPVGQGLKRPQMDAPGNGDKLINVLGTVAAPARQSGSSPASARAG